MNPYYTHQEYLTAELNKLDYSNPVNVLEFGTGDGSASIFQSFAKTYSNLTILSFESDYDWFIAMSKKYPANNYHFHHITSWDELSGFTGNFDLAFVDAGPDFEARIKIINYIKDTVKVIILHDYDVFNQGIIEDVFSISKGSFFERYNKEFVLQGMYDILPPTLIMRKL